MNTEKQPNIQIEQPLYTQQLTHQLPSDSAIYLILDGASFEASRIIFAGNAQPEFTLLYQNTQLHSQLELSPVIIRYDNNPALQNRFDQWQPHAVAFSTTLELSDTVEHLKSLIYCQLPNTQPALFRFYGRNWLEALISAQDHTTLYQFTGPIHRWYIPNPDHSWQQLNITEQTTPKTAQDYAWFKLTQPLQNKLANASTQQFIDELMAELGYNQSSVEQQLHYRSLLTQYTVQAQHYGINQTNQITHYIELALQFPTEIQSQPIINLLSDQTIMPNEKLQQLQNKLYALA